MVTFFVFFAVSSSVGEASVIPTVDAEHSLDVSLGGTVLRTDLENGSTTIPLDQETATVGLNGSWRDRVEASFQIHRVYTDGWDTAGEEVEVEDENSYELGGALRVIREGDLSLWLTGSYTWHDELKPEDDDLDFSFEITEDWQAGIRVQRDVLSPFRTGLRVKLPVWFSVDYVEKEAELEGDTFDLDFDLKGNGITGSIGLRARMNRLLDVHLEGRAGEDYAAGRANLLLHF